MNVVAFDRFIKDRFESLLNTAVCPLQNLVVVFEEFMTDCFKVNPPVCLVNDDFMNSVP